MRLRMSVVAAVVCVLVTVTSAQVDRGRIVGVITDTAGAVLPGVTVTLSGTESRTAVTNERGEFSFDNLLPGKYTEGGCEKKGGRKSSRGKGGHPRGGGGGGTAGGVRRGRSQQRRGARGEGNSNPVIYRGKPP